MRLRDGKTARWPRPCNKGGQRLGMEWRLGAGERAEQWVEVMGGKTPSVGPGQGLELAS